MILCVWARKLYGCKEQDQNQQRQHYPEEKMSTQKKIKEIRKQRIEKVDLRRRERPSVFLSFIDLSNVLLRSFFLFSFSDERMTAAKEKKKINVTCGITTEIGTKSKRKGGKSLKQKQKRTL